MFFWRVILCWFSYINDPILRRLQKIVSDGQVCSDTHYSASSFPNSRKQNVSLPLLPLLRKTEMLGIEVWNFFFSSLLTINPGTWQCLVSDLTFYCCTRAQNGLTTGQASLFAIKPLDIWQRRSKVSTANPILNFYYVQLLPILLECRR
jgi:hypothetical protein